MLLVASVAMVCNINSPCQKDMQVHDIKAKIEYVMPREQRVIFDHQEGTITRIDASTGRTISKTRMERLEHE